MRTVAVEPQGARQGLWILPIFPLHRGRLRAYLTTIKDLSQRRKRSRPGPNDVRLVPARPRPPLGPPPSPSPSARMTVTPYVPTPRSQTHGQSARRLR